MGMDMGEPAETRNLARRTWDHIVHPQRRGHGVRLIAAVILLIVSALPIERDNVPTWEKEIFESINHLPAWLNPPLQVVMQLGNLIAVPVIALLAYLMWRRWRVSIDIAISGVAAWILARVLKEAVGRGRPGDLLQEVILRDPAASGLGFVSGHTAVATAVATVLAAYLGARGTVVAVLAAVSVGISRIYVGAHLPLDVVGGAMMGWALGSLIHFFVLPELTGTDPDELTPLD